MNDTRAPVSMARMAEPPLCAPFVFVFHAPEAATPVPFCSTRTSVGVGGGVVIGGGVVVGGGVVGGGVVGPDEPELDVVVLEITSKASTHTQEPPDAELFVPVASTVSVCAPEASPVMENCLFWGL